ncbi:MAG: HAMP domain-containing sensor histidine kinase [Elusimicrobiota bacterium]
MFKFYLRSKLFYRLVLLLLVISNLPLVSVYFGLRYHLKKQTQERIAVSLTQNNLYLKNRLIKFSNMALASMDKAARKKPVSKKIIESAKNKNAVVISQGDKYFVGNLDWEMFVRFFSGLKNFDENRIFIVDDRNGNLLVYPQKNKAELAYLISETKTHPEKFFLNTLNADKFNLTLTAIEPKEKAFLSLKPIYAQMNKWVLNFCGIFSVFSLFFTLFLVRPLRMISEGAKMIKDDNLSQLIDVENKNEFGEVLTVLDKMKNKLSELDKLRDNFVSSVTHELRSPLTAIQGYVDFLLRRKSGELNPKQREYLVIVKNNAQRLTQFVNDVLDLAQIEKNMLDLNVLPTKISLMIEELIVLFRANAEENKIQLTAEYPENLPRALIDPERIIQVLTNLISNGLKFTPEGGKVAISVQELGDSLQVNVSDTGIGIPVYAREKLFTKFYQIKEGKIFLRKIKGTGLGLAIAKGIVDAHGGKIWLKNEAEKGSTFSFTVPKEKKCREEGTEGSSDGKEKDLSY